MTATEPPPFERAVGRRAALRSMALAALAGPSLLGACAGRGPGAWSLRRRRFVPVDVGWDRVIRTVVGLRPYRPSGFVVRPEKLDDTLVVHNYGHGGGGITLSWGTAHQAVEAALAADAYAYAVVGSGAVGLATARLLQRRGKTVTIYAKDLPPNTTSNIAGGQWSPFSVFDQDALTPAFDRQFREATRLAYRYYQQLLGPRYGVSWIENYYLSDGEPRQPAPFVTEMRDVYPDIETLGPDRHPFPVRWATRITTMLVQPHIYLAAMLDDFRIAGGRVVVRELHEPAQVAALPEPVVINCTGLGARALFGDEELVPIKGQLTVLVPQPEIDYITLGPGPGLYMFPRSDGILLGGTFQRGDWSLEPDEEARRRIVDGHVRLFRH